MLSVHKRQEARSKKQEKIIRKVVKGKNFQKRFLILPLRKSKIDFRAVSLLPINAFL